MQTGSGKKDMFLAPQKQIYNLMKFDSYGRFLKSELYNVRLGIKSVLAVRAAQSKVKGLLNIAYFGGGPSGSVEFSRSIDWRSLP